MRRLFLQIFQPKTIRALDYAASYPSQWINGGIPVDVLKKKFDKTHLNQLVDAGYLVIEDELIGVDDLKHKVYSLTPKANEVARSNKTDNSKKTGHESFWIGVTKGVLITVVGGLALAIIYLAVRTLVGVELPL